MSFIGTTSLRNLLIDSDIIQPLRQDRIKNGAYELSLGAQVFQTDSSERAIKNLTQNEQIEIRPGQFALLLTKEYVKVPKNKIAFISIKAGIKFKGLVNVSGFHVDPGFEGNLMFSVYNAGPSNIRLSNSTAYFPMWFSELNETQEYEGNHNKQIRIPDDPVEALSQNELASPNVLSKRIDDNQSVLNKKIDDNQKELDRKISLIEKDSKANNYVAVTAIGVVVAILIKLAFDWYTFKYGLDKGLEMKNRELSMDSLINRILMEKTKIDSVINVRLSEKKNLLIEIDSLERIKVGLKKK